MTRLDRGDEWLKAVITTSRRRWTWRACVGLASVLLSGSCSSGRSEREISDLLVVLPHASEIQAGPHQVLYRMSEPYPAASTLKALDERLARQGCRAADQDPLNAPPGLMRRTWDEVDQKGGGTRQLWMGAWLCDRGDVVTFSISVAEPGAHAGWPLGVAGGYISASQVRMLRAKTRATP